MLDVSLMIELTVQSNCFEWWFYNHVFDIICRDKWIEFTIHEPSEGNYEGEWFVYEDDWSYADEYGGKTKWYHSCLLGIFSSLKLAEKHIERRKRFYIENPSFLYCGRTSKYDAFRKFFNNRYSIKYRR